MLKTTKMLILFFMLCSFMLLLGCASKPTQSKSTAQGSKNPSNVKTDIVYKSVNSKQLKLDVYYPANIKNTSKTPTVLLIHGRDDDNDNLKDSYVFKIWGKQVAESGFTAVTFNWRPLASITDVKDLIKYIRENHKELNINSENISIITFSAGVMEGTKEAMEVNTGFIKNVIAYYGKIDESILTAKPNVKMPSFFIAMGALDELFPPNTNDNFISKAKASGYNVTKMVHSKGGHGFDFLTGDDETEDIINKTLKFIKDNSGL